MEDNKVTIKNSQILNANIRFTIKQPKLEDMKVKIWDKELCNGAEWNDFLKAVEEKGRENRILKEALRLASGKIEFMAQMLGQTLDYNVEENLIEQAKENTKW